MEKPRAKHYLKPALMVLFSLPVLYVLSVGPVALISEKFNLRKTNPALMELLVHTYNPLAQLAENNPAAEKAFDWYALGLKIIRENLWKTIVNHNLGTTLCSFFLEKKNDEQTRLQMPALQK